MQILSRILKFLGDIIKEYLPFLYLLTTSGQAKNALNQVAEYIEDYLSELLPAGNVDITLGSDSSIIYTVKLSDDRKVQFVLSTTHSPSDSLTSRIVETEPVIYLPDLIDAAPGNDIPYAVIRAAVNKIVKQ